MRKNTKIQIKKIFMESSRTLEKTFDQHRSLEASTEKYEQLLEMWIHPDFATRLSHMFEEIKATAEEVMQVQDEIITADTKIAVKNEQIHMNSTQQKRWYLSGRYQAAANDDEYRLSA